MDSSTGMTIHARSYASPSFRVRLRGARRLLAGIQQMLSIDREKLHVLQHAYTGFLIYSKSWLSNNKSCIAVSIMLCKSSFYSYRFFKSVFCHYSSLLHKYVGAAREELSDLKIVRMSLVRSGNLYLIKYVTCSFNTLFGNK